MNWYKMSIPECIKYPAFLPFIAFQIFLFVIMWVSIIKHEFDILLLVLVYFKLTAVDLNIKELQSKKSSI